MSRQISGEMQDVMGKLVEIEITQQKMIRLDT